MHTLQKKIFIALQYNLLMILAIFFAINKTHAKDVPREYLSELEQEVIAELNLARTQPQTYAKFLEQYSRLFVGREVHEYGEIPIVTAEGKRAVDEAVQFLKRQKTLSPLTPSKGMSQAAADMVKMQGKTTQTGHKGRDGSSFHDRLNRHGTWMRSCSENIDYGYNNARKIIMALIIDDGVKNRGHRKSLFTAPFKKVGVACGDHRKYKYMCVIELAQDYQEK